MEEDLKNNIIILALNNLVESYNLLLEDKENTLEQDDRDLMQFIVESCHIILSEYSDKLINPKPEWNQILP